MWDKGIGFRTNILKTCVPVWHEHSQQRTANMEPNRWLRLILNFYGKNFIGEYGGGSVYFPNGVLLEPSSVSQICHLRSREACQDKLSTTETARRGELGDSLAEQLHAHPHCRYVTPAPASSTVRLELFEQPVGERSITRCWIRIQSCPAGHSDALITHRGRINSPQKKKMYFLKVLVGP